MTKNLLLLLIFLSFFTNLVIGQNADIRYPLPLDQFDQSLYLTNPALTPANHKVTLNAGYKSFTGLRKNIKRFYSGGFYRFGKGDPDSMSVIHIAGINTYSDHESEHIRRNFFYLTYAIHIRVSPKYYIASGASLGGTNILEVSPLRNGADTGPDGKIGVALLSKNFSMGAAVNSIFNPELRPILHTEINKSYYSFYLRKNFVVSQNVEASFSSNIRYLNKDKQDYAAMAKLLLIRKLEFGLNYRPKDALIYIVGIKDIYLNNTNSFNLLFSFNTPVYNNPLSKSYSYELSLGYYLR